MSTALRLSEILGRDVAIEWFEAVALVREVAARVRDNSAGRAVPELDQVLLSADGTVSLTGASNTDEPIRRLGQLLQACLVQSDPPVQLRLVAAQATAPEPGYSAIRDYDEALAYFERPDRPSVLAALFLRAQAIPAALNRLPTLDAIAPLDVAPVAKEKPGARQPLRLSRAQVAATIIVLVGLVVSVTAYTQFGVSSAKRTDVTAVATKASDAVGTTLVKGISAVSEAVGLGRLVPASEVGKAPPAPPAIAPVAPKGATAAKRRSPPALRIYDLEAPPLNVATVPVPAEPVVPTVTPPPVAAEADVTDVTVYSADDASVAPPVGVRPQLPRVLPQGVSTDQLSQIELVVLPDGTVGSVKLLGPKQGVLEGMLLSAAKAWTFKPAEKNGRPVAYRKTVWLIRD